MPRQEENIIWLASYPKSGNTWLRIFLNNLLSDLDEPVNINTLNKTGPISSARIFFDELIGIDSSDLTYKEIDFYLPKVHLARADSLEEKTIIKTHDALTIVPPDQFIIPVAATYKVIYLIRNPLDVCVSFAHYSGKDQYDITVKQMADTNMMLAKTKKKQNEQLHQYLGSWSNHVNSWTRFPKNKLQLIRYEDMKHKPFETFSKIVEFLNLDYTRKEITQAIEFSDFSNLQNQEKENGFKERHRSAKRFFRKGETGSWRDNLSEMQVKALIDCHRQVMKANDYLDENDNPIF